MKTLFLFVASLLSFMVQAQQNKNVKLYAYYQTVVPGIQKARGINEGGGQQPAKQPEAGGNYLIYAGSSSALRLYPVALWIKGQKYGVRMKTGVQTPVTHANPSTPATSEPAVLVPKTSAKVIQLIPVDAMDSKSYPAAERLAESNELVFVFKQGGKFYYQSLQKFSSLSAVNMQ